MSCDENRVCISRCHSYDEAELTNRIDRQFQALGVYEQLKAGMNVVLKPNLVMDSKPESAAITHPAVTAAVASCVKKDRGKSLDSRERRRAV